MIATWSNSTGTTSVDMYMYNNTTSTQVGSDIIGVTSPRSITGLTAGNSYTVFLRMNDSTNTINQTGEWGIGGTTASTTTTDTTPPSQVLGLILSTPVDYTVKIDWATTTDNVGVTQYEINESLNGSTWNLLTIVNAPTLTYTQSGYGPQVQVWIRVRAKDAAGNYGIWSVTENIFTTGAL